MWIRFCLLEVVTHTRLELVLPPWKGDVLTAWPWGLIKNRRRPNFPGSFPPSIFSAKELNFCVRDGNRCNLSAIVTGLCKSRFAIYSYFVVRCTLSSSTLLRAVPSKLNNHLVLKTIWSSVRPISISQLNTLPYLHLWPINVIVSHGSYLSEEILSWGGLRT